MRPLHLLVVLVKLAIITSLWSARLFIDRTAVKSRDRVFSAVGVVIAARRVLAKHSLDH